MPTGLETRCQETRSQLQNREIALEILYARVYDHFKRIKQQEDTKVRRQLKGTGDRSEKIRTYNFPQDRITDHRFEMTLHGMDNMMKGLLLDQFVETAENFHRRQLIDDLMNER
jgi:peptide chain release factor 1